MIKLLGSELSPFVAKARLAMRYMDIPFEEVHINTMQDPQELTQFNPLGKIPALIAENNEVYFDSTVILSYLNLISTGKKIFPQDPIERLKVERTQSIADGLGDVMVAHIYERRYRPAEIVHQPWLDKQWGKVTRTLDYIEKNLPSLDHGLDAGSLTLGIMLNFAEQRFEGQWQIGRPALQKWWERFHAQYPQLQKPVQHA